MTEVDWNSLFTSFFSMVRVKIVCKDATKVPSKRLFEMEKKMYLIHFKVDKASTEEGEGDGGDDDNNDFTVDDDLGMEEIDHAETDPKTSPSKEKKEDSNKPAHGQHPSDQGGSSKRVAAWARLFQEDENMG
jgi:hypothetical protein